MSQSQSQSDQEPHGEDVVANPSAPNETPVDVAFSLRDALEERLKAYNEGLSGTARLYGTGNQGINMSSYIIFLFEIYICFFNLIYFCTC